MWGWGPGVSGVKTRIYVFGTVFSLTMATPGGDREGGGANLGTVHMGLRQCPVWVSLREVLQGSEKISTRNLMMGLYPSFCVIPRNLFVCLFV